eukprot:GGOE01026605.1.p1 GENE.GGOE01026605.1~~GGOE01026605.1.p1  ORF type:complete len:352 (-),score=73.33 GGOE01026605.1:657-1712(-)
MVPLDELPFQPLMSYDDADWLHSIEADVPGRRRESRTTAFWRAVARRFDQTRWDDPADSVVSVSNTSSLGTTDDPLTKLGHLVDEVLAAFLEPEVCQVVLHCILTHSGWSTRTCHSQDLRSLFSSGFLLVWPPSSVTRFVIDFTFTEKFHTVRPSRRLNDLLRAMPATFVGTHEALFKCIDWCAGVVQESLATSSLEIAPWRTGLQLQQVYTLCHQEEICGLLSIFHRSSAPHCTVPACRTGLESAHVSPLAVVQSFVQYLNRAAAHDGQLGPAAALSQFVDPRALLDAVQAAESGGRPCPWLAEDTDPFRKVLTPPQPPPAHSLLARLLVAAWYQRMAVRRLRCPGAVDM